MIPIADHTVQQYDRLKLLPDQNSHGSHGSPSICRHTIISCTNSISWNYNGQWKYGRTWGPVYWPPWAMVYDRLYSRDFDHIQRFADKLLSVARNPLHQFPRSKSVVISWHGQQSVVSVVSCRFPNSITTTCCHLPASWQLRGNVCNGFWA